MSKYNFEKYDFKKMFGERIIQTNDYLSNGHFGILKSNLKNNQTCWMLDNSTNKEEEYKGIANLLEGYRKVDTILYFIPERIVEIYNNGNTYNTIFMEVEGKYIGIKEEYYNLFNDLNLEITLSSKEYGKPLILCREGEYIGIVLPVSLDEEISRKSIYYSSYRKNEITKEEQKNKEKELKKSNSKKCLYIKNNEAKVSSKEIYPLSDLLQHEEFKNVYYEITDNNYAMLYIDFEIIHYAIGRGFYLDTEKEELKERLSNLKTVNLKEYKEYLIKSIKNNQFVNVSEIKLMELSGESQEFINQLKEYRENYIAKREREEKEKKEQREIENQKYIDDKNAIAEKQVEEFIQNVKAKKEITNDDVTFYKSRYEYNTTSIILYMMKKHNIKVPLKTQGWIVAALSSIYYDTKNEYWSYRYFKSSVNSTVFYDYFKQLIQEILSK